MLYDILVLGGGTAGVMAAVQAGREGTKTCWQKKATGWGGTGVTGETTEGRTALALSARLTILRLLRFFRTQPGLENIRLEALYPECGIRESVRIVGRSTVTTGRF